MKENTVEKSFSASSTLNDTDLQISETPSTMNSMTPIFYSFKGKNIMSDSGESSGLVSTTTDLPGSRVSEFDEDCSISQNQHYDPLANCLTPRPKFLKYDDSPEIEFTKGGEIFNGEDDNSEDQNECIEEKEGKGWGLKKILKFIVFLTFLVFYMNIISSPSSPVENSETQAMHSNVDFLGRNGEQLNITEGVEEDDHVQISQDLVNLELQETEIYVNEERIFQLEMEETVHDDDQAREIQELQTIESARDLEILDYKDEYPEFQQTLISESSSPFLDLFFNTTKVTDRRTNRIEEFEEQSDMAELGEINGEMREGIIKPDSVKTTISMATMLLCSIPLSFFFLMWLWFVLLIRRPASTRTMAKPVKKAEMKKKIMEAILHTPNSRQNHEKTDYNFPESVRIVQTAQEDLRETQRCAPMIELLGEIDFSPNNKSTMKKKKDQANKETIPSNPAVKSPVTIAPRRRSSRIRNKKTP